MAVEKLKTLEWVWSLWNLVWDHIVKPYGIYAAALAMLTAAGAALYSAGEWINNFGAAGWILAVVAAIIIGALLVGLIAWAIDRVRTVRTERVKATDAEPKLRGLPLSQRLDNIDFTLFHLTTRVVADLHVHVVQRALARMPMKQRDINLASATNDALNYETESLDDFVRSVGGDFVNTHWWRDVAGELRLIEYKADQELRSVQIPAALNLLDYRLNYIARLHRDRVAKFLEWVLDEERTAQGQALNMMYQRKELHQRS